MPKLWVAIQYSPWRWFRPSITSPFLSTLYVAIQYSPWRWFRRGRQPANFVDCKESQSSIRPGDDSDSIMPRARIRQLVNRSQSSIRPGDDSDMISSPRILRMPTGRNPVFALEMIQTFPHQSDQSCDWPRSQSSIRPGDDSDVAQPSWIPALASKSQSSIRPGDDSDRNAWSLPEASTKGRNPVFALEMIQTSNRQRWSGRH